MSQSLFEKIFLHSSYALTYCGILCQNSVDVARCGALIRDKISP
ncbi:MAG: DUF6783 domain-containing protein [Ruminococcus sp.]